MSNALALAAVTAVMKDLLDNALIDASVSSAVGGTITVSALPPDRIEVGENETARLNLFLYQVAPNPALRNMDLPSRDGRGGRIRNAPLALDLYYLLSAYSAQDFEAEILLGYGMLMLHENPVLTRGAIRETLSAPSVVDGAILPPAMNALVASDLAEQMELVKVAPHHLNTEELSRLWTAFQAKFRPSAAYVATVVLIESREPTRSPLPVLSRGEPDPETGRDRGIIAITGLVPPYPSLLSAIPPDSQLAVRMGELLTLTGRRLEADTVFVRFTHVRSGDTLELEAEPGATATTVTVRIPPSPPVDPVAPASPLNPANWEAGVYAVAVVLRGAGEADRLTNTLPVVLAPRLDAIAAAPGVGEFVTVTLDVSPPVRRTQRTRLIVGSGEVSPDDFPAESMTTLTFTSDTFASGQQFVRLRVDEGESLLIDRSARSPVFDASQRVDIP